MANSTGNSISLPRESQQSLPMAMIPEVRVAQNDGGAAALFSIGSVLKGVSRNVEDRLDIQAKIEGTKQGQIAGMGEDLPELQDESTIRGAAFDQSAKDAALTKLSLQGRLKISQIEQENMADPAKFKQAADAYLSGTSTALMNFDPAVAQSYESDYSLRQDAALSRVKERQQNIISENMQENALRLQMSINDEIGQQAQTLFTGDPQNVQKTLTSMSSNAARIVDVAHQIGPNGRPLFTAEQRVAFEKDAEKTLASNVAMAWMAQQPDMLTAFHTWSKGEASFAVAGPDGKAVTMPLKQVLGESVYAHAQDAFMAQFKSQLALEAQINTEVDRNFKKTSDATFSDLTVKAQDGGLTLDTVEAAKANLEPEKYTALRSLAKTTGATVSDGPTITRLTTADVEGQNITGQLTQEYEAGKLSQQDYLKLYERNSSRMTQGQKDPISQGRDFVGGSLGKLSTELGMTQSLLISEAEADYALRIDDLVRAKRKQRKDGDPEVTQNDLTLRETLDIAKQVKDRYSLLAGDKSIVSLEVPKFMTAAQKYSNKFTSKDITDTVRKTREYYLNKNNGDETALRDDKEYQYESALLAKYYDALRYKEGAADGGTTGK